MIKDSQGNMFGSFEELDSLDSGTPVPAIYSCYYHRAVKTGMGQEFFDSLDSEGQQILWSEYDYDGYMIENAA